MYYNIYKKWRKYSKRKGPHTDLCSERPFNSVTRKINFKKLSIAMHYALNARALAWRRDADIAQYTLAS